jgi:hypothetical protein
LKAWPKAPKNYGIISIPSNVETARLNRKARKMRAYLLPIFLALLGCDGGMPPELLTCETPILGDCDAGYFCVNWECRPVCTTDDDCQTCCLAASEGAPKTCAPADYCD